MDGQNGTTDALISSRGSPSGDIFLFRLRVKENALMGQMIEYATKPRKSFHDWPSVKKRVGRVGGNLGIFHLQGKFCGESCLGCFFTFHISKVKLTEAYCTQPFITLVMRGGASEMTLELL